MSNRRRHLGLCLLLPLLACGRIEPVDSDASDDSSTDVDLDAGPDVRPDITPDAPADPVTDCPPVRIPFEAEDMMLSGSFAVSSNTTDTVGEYIYADTGLGRASIDIGIPCMDEYVLWGLVWWETMDTDSYVWSMDSTSTRQIWDFLQCSGSVAGWYWDQVTTRPDSTYCTEPVEDPAILVLAEGDHTFSLTPRETGSIVAEFVLTNDMGFTPTPP